MMDVNEQLRALEFQPSCEAGEGAEGQHPAEIYVRCRKCGDTHLLCERALSSARAQSAALGLSTRATRCCGVVGGAPLEELFEIGKLEQLA